MPALLSNYIHHKVWVEITYSKTVTQFSEVMMSKYREFIADIYVV